MQTTPYLQSVRAQYEDYPYPKRNPENEKTSLIATYIDPLDIINYYCFGGRQDFQNNFRILVAGGGTGDSTIFLAEQLRDTNAEIVYVDISTASMDIAKKRAEIRGLTNIRWVHHSLLEIPNLGLGTFDYINCIGVLHHLADPSAGLQALTAVLKEDGVLGVMVYAKYGRTGIYDMQELMRILGKHTTDPQEKIELCKEVLTQLPPTNSFALSAKGFQSDIQDSGDIGIYDLFLHSQDRSYSLLELYDWIKANGMEILDLVTERGLAKLAYSSTFYLHHDAYLDKKIRTRGIGWQKAIAELCAGNILKHSCFLSRQYTPKLAPDDDNAIPVFSMFVRVPDVYEKLYDALKAQNIWQQNGKLLLRYRNMHLPITPNRHTLDLFRFIDGQRTVRDIINGVIEAGITKDTPENHTLLLQQFVQLYKECNLYDWMLLRHKSVPVVKSLAELQTPVTARYTSAESKLSIGQ